MKSRGYYMNKRALNVSGLLIAFGLLIILPVWVFGFKFLAMKTKLLFTLFGGIAVYYFVEHGGTKRGVFAK